MRLPFDPPTSSTLFPISSVLLSSIWIPFMYQVMTSLPTQLRLWRRADQMLDRNFLHNGSEFDFIVVGGGLSGSVVANRLTRSGFSVLLLEAGGEPFFLQLVPGFMLGMINHPETDWMYRSVPQKKGSLNSVKQESSWSMGKGLGGTGTLNIMIFLRGHRKDFDNWARITNDSSWSFDGLMPHFKSIEDYQSGHCEKTEVKGPCGARTSALYHGDKGDMRIAEPDYLGLADDFVAAAEEFGYPKVDLNGPYGSSGFDRIKYPIKQGRRIASYEAFIQPMRNNRKLTIMKYSHVDKILFSANKTAYGVEYTKFGKSYTAVASKEVIISAGTVNTAKLLLLSGIGPKDDLQNLEIPVIQDLPVGQNLQDHIGVYLHPFFVSPPGKTIRLDRDYNPAAISAWLHSGKGVLSSSGVQATGVLTSSLAVDPEHPDLHFFLFGFSCTGKVASMVSHAFNLEEKEIQDYFSACDEDPRDSFFLVVSGARPLSKGFVQLASKDPTKAPIIDPKYLEDPEEVDLKVLIEGVKLAVNMVENSTSLGSKLGASFGFKNGKKLPGCETHPERSDAYWECYVRRYTVTLHHPVGTCRMGRNDDPESVVDPELRVKGVHRLRVMDSSIQPEIVVTNTAASALVIGEKGADLLVKEWFLRAKQKDVDKDKDILQQEDNDDTNTYNSVLDNRLRRRKTQ